MVSTDETRSWCQVGDIEAEVTDNFSFDVATRRVTFVAPDGIWALRFGTAAKYSDFVMQYNSKLFENTYGVENDEVNRGKVGNHPRQTRRQHSVPFICI